MWVAPPRTWLPHPTCGQSIPHMGCPIPHMNSPIPHENNPIPHVNSPIPHMGSPSHTWTVHPTRGQPHSTREQLHPTRGQPHLLPPCWIAPCLGRLHPHTVSHDKPFLPLSCFGRVLCHSNGTVTGCMGVSQKGLVSQDEPGLFPGVLSMHPVSLQTLLVTTEPLTFTVPILSSAFSGNMILQAILETASV